MNFYFAGTLKENKKVYAIGGRVLKTLFLFQKILVMLEKK